MKKVLKSALSVCLILGFCFILPAQDTPLSSEFKTSTINNLSQMMNDRYVFPDVAKKTSEHLKKQLKAGHFKQYTDISAFADALTQEVQSINKDKHMRIWTARPTQAKESTIDAMIEEHLYRINRSRTNTGGFNEAKKMEGNVGYVDFRGFASLESGKDYVDSFMKLLSTSDAIIIDLRKNGGGSPHMVQYICSFFFDKKIHLNSLYFREGNQTNEFWTLDEVNGDKMPDIPLFVLTSDYTFSGAEEFSYNMQTQKRATLIGQTTKGGANPGGVMPINEKLSVFIPTGKAINPITKTNWEGTGVVPEVKTSKEETLSKAHELAKIAAKEYQEAINKKQKALLTKMANSFESFSAANGDQAIIENIKSCVEAGVIGEGMINGLGYEYLMKYKKPKVAEAIFKSNTLLFPEHANVYDSYGEALAMNGKLDASLKNYEKAVEVAKATEDRDLNLFIENLKKAKTKMNEKP